METWAHREAGGGRDRDRGKEENWLLRWLRHAPPRPCVTRLIKHWLLSLCMLPLLFSSSMRGKGRQTSMAPKTEEWTDRHVS